MTAKAMPDMRALLAANPRSFNELLDLFEAFLASVDAPLMKATHKIGEELNYREGDIFGHIVGVVDDADLMAKQLRKIRAAHNAGSSITLAMERGEASNLLNLASELPVVIHEAAGVMDYLHVADASGCMKGMEGEAAGILSLCSRGLRAFAENDRAPLGRLEMALRDASRPNAEEAA